MSSSVKQQLGNFGDEEGGKCNVEQNGWLHSVHHVEQQESCRFPGSYMVSPNCVRGHNWPLSDISVAGFYD